MRSKNQYGAVGKDGPPKRNSDVTRLHKTAREPAYMKCLSLKVVAILCVRIIYVVDIIIYTVEPLLLTTTPDVRTLTL